jgi:virulence-associated protein VagC
MNEAGSPVPRRVLFVVAGVAAAAALAAGVFYLRRSQSVRIPIGERNEVEFKVSALSAPLPEFWELVPVLDRLWVTTNGGPIVVIDPVAEQWTLLALGPNSLDGARIVPCGLNVWLLLRSGVALVNLEKRTFEIRGVNEGLPVTLGGIRRAFCGSDGLWLYVAGDGGLYRVPLSGAGAQRYETRGPALPSDFHFAESLQDVVYFLRPHYASGYSGLFRFDPSSLKFDRVELPGDPPLVSLERTDQGVLVRSRDSRAFLLKVDGQPWTEVSLMRSRGEPVLAEGNGVVWVGASYDVSPASYFVLRYIRDAMQPKDLLILPRAPDPLRAPVHYLGMLWAVSGRKVLRIDPSADELVSYEVTDSTGMLKKTSFSLTKDSAGLRYFDGEILRPFSEIVPRYQEIPESTAADTALLEPADLGKEPER